MNFVRLAAITALAAAALSLGACCSSGSMSPHSGGSSRSIGYSK